MSDPKQAELVDAAGEESLLDLLDNLLDKGVVVKGEVILGLAQVDLIYLSLTAVLCAADKVLPVEATGKRRRRGAPARRR